MPEPTPTTTGPKASKKLPTWALAAGAVVIVGGIFYIKSKRAKESTGEATPYTSQAFIPVTGENVAGVGAGFGSTGATVGNTETESALLHAYEEQSKNTLQFLTESRKSQEQEGIANREFLKTALENIRNTTGGGPPSEGQKSTGGGSGGGGEGAKPTNQPAPPHAAAKCPKAYSLWNPANGAPSPHSCYRPAAGGHECPHSKKKHEYQDGHHVCL